MLAFVLPNEVTIWVRALRTRLSCWGCAWRRCEILVDIESTAFSRLASHSPNSPLGRVQLPFLGACRTLDVDSENRPQRGQFLPGSQAHSTAMGQETGEKWTAAADLQPTFPKSDRLLG